MAWTTSGNLRDFLGAREFPATSETGMPQQPSRMTGHRLRQWVIFAFAVTHLALLAELTFIPAIVEQNPASASPTLGLSFPWLTVSGVMLALLWLTRDWPITGKPAQFAASNVPTTSAIFYHPVRSVSSQNKSAPMTGLLARVSHDLRTPLNAVMGFSDMMQQEAFGPLGDARYQSYARHIHSSSVELLKAAEDTLAMTSLVASHEKSAHDVVALDELISDAFTMALLGAPKPLTRAPNALRSPVMLGLSIPRQLMIQCERRALRQAMINLISAAIGKVAADASDVRTVNALATTSDDMICLTVSVTTGPDHSLVQPQGSSNQSDAIASSWNSAEDLPICLARALLELQGLNLTLSTASNVWSAQVILDGVSQRDFFSK
jgi:His Kinase A (phospho-acceptor) domain